MGGIYHIINILNMKEYVGSAVDIRKRWNLHRADLRKGTHHCKPLQRAWNKYGASAFEFVVIEQIEKNEDLIPIEQLYLDAAYQNKVQYNTCRIAGSRLGVKASEETREKLRISHLGKSSHLGLLHTEESKKKMSASLKGRTV